MVDAINLLSLGTTGGSDWQAYSTFDGENRITSTSYVSPYVDQQGTVQWWTGIDHTFQYDAENHITGADTQFCYYGSYECGGGTYYAWGPTGRIVTSAQQFEGSQNSEAVFGSWLYHGRHWDGSTLAATSTSTGSVDDVKLGVDGDYLSDGVGGYNGATYYDRDVNLAGDNYLGRLTTTILAG